MNVSSSESNGFRLGAPAWERLVERSPDAPTFEPKPDWETDQLRDRFNDFVAGTFFKAMLEAMRKTVGKNPLIHGGRAEEIFRAQLDNTIAQKLADRSGSGFSEKLFEQFLRQQATDTQAKAPTDGPTNTYRQPSPADAGRLRDDTL